MQKANIFRGLKISALSFLLAVIVQPAISYGDNFFALLLRFQGVVEFKSNNESEYRPVYWFKTFAPEDQLKLAPGAVARVFCGNLTIWEVPDNKESVIKEGCPWSGNSNVEIISSLLPSRGSVDQVSHNSKIPYIISPRDTWILDKQPTLKWNAVPDATSYQVQLKGPGVNWSQKVFGTNKIVYTGEEPLKPGLPYDLIVEVADAGKDVSSRAEKFRDNEFDPSFFLLYEDEAQQVKDKAHKIEQLPLNKEEKAFLLAHLYETKDLKAEAIKSLETLVKDGTQKTAVYQFLGDMYQKLLLDILAKQYYLKAHEIADVSRQMERQAAVQTSLGTVEYALNNDDAAYQWFNKAKNNYTALGEKKQVDRIEEWIKIILEGSKEAS